MIRLILLEFQKTKGTGLFWLLTAGTLSVNLSFTLLARFLPTELSGAGPIATWTDWIDFHYQGILGLLLPMFLVIICALSNLLEERNGTWKLLHTQPIAKSQLYVGKILALILMFALAHLAFVVLMVLVPMVSPFVHFTPNQLPFTYLLKLVMITIVSSLSIIGLMFLISYVSRLFIISLLIGIMGFVLAQFLHDFGLGHSYLPFALPIYGLDQLEKTGQVPTDLVAISLAYFVAFLAAGFVASRRRVMAR